MPEAMLLNVRMIFAPKVLASLSEAPNSRARIAPNEPKRVMASSISPETSAPMASARMPSARVSVRMPSCTAGEESQACIASATRIRSGMNAPASRATRPPIPSFNPPSLSFKSAAEATASSDIIAPIRWAASAISAAPSAPRLISGASSWNDFPNSSWARISRWVSSVIRPRAEIRSKVTSCVERSLPLASLSETPRSRKVLITSRLPCVASPINFVVRPNALPIASTLVPVCPAMNLNSWYWVVVMPIFSAFSTISSEAAASFRISAPIWAFCWEFVAA